MKKLLIIIIVIASGFVAKSQEVILNQYVYPDSVRGNWGQNKSHWMHFYGAFGFITPIDQSTWSPIYFGKASNWELGLRYKKRITNWLAIGGNISYDFFNYRMEQSIEKTFPDKQFYDKQKVLIHNFSMQPFIRINYGRRGNKIGNYVDFGFFYNAIMSSREKLLGTPAGLDKVIIKNPDYMPGDYYGFFTNIGFGRWVIYAKYQYSGIIKGDTRYADLPPVTIGLQLGFF
jgi:hypothetical protein